MNKWSDYFEIKERIEAHHFKYDLIAKETQKVVATYNDELYAIKQAKFKFKKIIKQVERILLG